MGRAISRLFSPPSSLCILNPPTRLRLIDPAFGENRFNLRDAFSRNVVGFGNFAIKIFAVTIFSLDQLLDFSALLEIQTIRAANHEQTILADADIAAVHKRFDRVTPLLDRVLEGANRWI